MLKKKEQKEDRSQLFFCSDSVSSAGNNHILHKQDYILAIPGKHNHDGQQQTTKWTPTKFRLCLPPHEFFLALELGRWAVAESRFLFRGLHAWPVWKCCHWSDLSELPTLCPCKIKRPELPLSLLTNTVKALTWAIKQSSNLVFYAKSTITVISGQGGQ